MQIKAGGQVTATKDARFPAHISPEQHFSQRAGDMMLVNRVHADGSVSGAGLNGTAHNGRPCIGLCGGFDAGTFRLATSDDPGFLQNSDKWAAELRRLRRESFAWGVVGLLSLGALALEALKCSN